MFNNKREIVEWLLAGGGVSNGGRQVWFKDGFVDQDGNRIGLSIMSDASLYSKVEACPFQSGTYLWAKFHHRLGRSVRRSYECTIHSTSEWSRSWFRAEDFEATDWELL